MENETWMAKYNGRKGLDDEIGTEEVFVTANLFSNHPFHISLASNANLV